MMRILEVVHTDMLKEKKYYFLFGLLGKDGIVKKVESTGRI